MFLLLWVIEEVSVDDVENELALAIIFDLYLSTFCARAFYLFSKWRRISKITPNLPSRYYLLFENLRYPPFSIISCCCIISKSGIIH